MNNGLPVPFLIGIQQKLAFSVSALSIGAYAMSCMLYGSRVQKEGEPPIVRGDAIYGCSPAMKTDVMGFTLKCQNKYGNIFTMRMDNAYMTFVLDNPAIKKLLAHKNADFDSISVKSKRRFGLTKITTMYKGMTKLSYMLQKSFADKVALETLVKSVYQVTKQVCKNMENDVALSNHISKNIPMDKKKQNKLKNNLQNLSSVDSQPLISKMLSYGNNWVVPKDKLYGWVKKLVFKIEAKVIFGDKFGDDDELYKLFRSFCNDVPLRLAGKQQLITGPAMTKIEAIIDRIVKNAANDKQNEIPHVLKIALEYQQQYKLPSVELNRLLLLMLWAAITNSTNAVFWVLIRKLRHPEINKKIEDEVLIQSYTFDMHDTDDSHLSHVQVHNFLPNMSGLMREVFRYYSQSDIYRVLLEDVDVEVAGKQYHLRKGDWFGCNAVYLHHNEKYFEKPYEFIPGRFVNDESVNEKRRISRFNQKKAKHVLAFGSRCVGRHFAENVITAIVCFIAYNFEFEILDKNWKIPTEGNAPSLSMKTIQENEDVSFRFRERPMPENPAPIENEDSTMDVEEVNKMLKKDSKKDSKPVMYKQETLGLKMKKKIPEEAKIKEQVKGVSIKEENK